MIQLEPIIVLIYCKVSFVVFGESINTNTHTQCKDLESLYIYAFREGWNPLVWDGAFHRITNTCECVWNVRIFHIVSQETVWSQWCVLSPRTERPQTHIMPGRMTKAWHCERPTYAQWETTYVYVVKAGHHIFGCGNFCKTCMFINWDRTCFYEFY